MIVIRIVNSRTGEVLASDAQVARTFWQRLWGLMGRPSLPAGGALVLYPVNGVHTFFMRFPIDVIHLDRSGRVLRLVPSMPPGRLGPLVRGGVYTLELPATGAGATRAGDLLQSDPALWPIGSEQKKPR